MDLEIEIWELLGLGVVEAKNEVVERKVLEKKTEHNLEGH